MRRLTCTVPTHHLPYQVSRPAESRRTKSAPVPYGRRGARFAETFLDRLGAGRWMVLPRVDNSPSQGRQGTVRGTKCT